MQMPFTSTLPDNLMEEFNAFIMQTGKKKNEVIVESLKQYLKKEKQKLFAESFKRAALDKELVDLAEMGLVDYSKQLKRLDK